MSGVYVTANFERNLDATRRFLEEQDAPRAFQDLLDELFETVIPNLERFPEMGADLLRREPQSMEGLARLARLLERLGRGTKVREYISGDYLVLYALRADDVYLLSIKHHRQLSFDLRGHWL